MNRNSENGHSRVEILDKLKKLAEAEGLDPAEMAANIASQLTTFKDRAKDKVSEVASRVDKSARARPWYYIGAAALSGYLAARFIRR